MAEPKPPKPTRDQLAAKGITDKAAQDRAVKSIEELEKARLRYEEA